MKYAIAIALFAVVLFGSCKKEAKDLSYNSSSLTIDKISEHCYIHTSYLQTESFGKVECNGLITIKNDKAFIYDTPTSDSVADEMIQLLKSKGITIEGVVCTHFHVDCLGGLTSFHNSKIPSYAQERTIERAKKDSLEVPLNPIRDSLFLKMEGLSMSFYYPGKGHTEDNIVCFVHDDETLFGGCLVKSVGSGKGNLADADTSSWSGSIKNVMKHYPSIEHVVPGHGEAGGRDLLLYTEKMFATND